MAGTVFIGIGSNLGDKEGNIRRALQMLAEDGRISVVAVAPLYKTDPVGNRDQDWFLNTVAAVDTALPPLELLKVLSEIEDGMGRRRTVRWGPRVIDLDILLYGEERINMPDLQIPHPGVEERAFVAVPLADLHPGLMLPCGATAAELAAELAEKQHVEKYGE